MGDEYIPSKYEQNGIIAGFRGVPRFGHSDDISNFFSTEQADNSDYTLGTLFIGSFLMTIFLTWFIALLILTFIGKDKVGFLSGYAMEKTVGGQHSTTPAKKCCVTTRNVRIVFIISCLVVIIVSLLSAFSVGFVDLKIATEDMQNSVLEIKDLAFQSQSSTRTLGMVGDYSATLRQVVVPDLRYQNFCSDDELDTKTELPFNETRQRVVDDLEALDDFNVMAFESMNTDLLEEMRARSQNAWTFFSTFGIQQWQILSFVISYCIIASFMMLTTILSWAGKPSPFLICLSTWFLLPTLIVLVILSWLIVSALSVAAVMDADFCTGGSMLEGPDLTTMTILQQSKIEDQSTLLFDASVYWFNGCQSECPFDYIENYRNLLTASMASMAALTEMIKITSIMKLEKICGIIGDFDTYSLYFNKLTNNFVKMSTSLEELESNLSCETMNTIYTEAIHHNACTEVPYGLLWAFSSLLIVSFFGMVMITLRPAWLEVREKRSRMAHEMPIISMKIQDLEDERFNDSPHGQDPNDAHFTEATDSNSRLTETDLSRLTENRQSPEQSIHDPVAMYQTISVADESLKEIPSSPKDPPGYRVY
jgi:hypothetical protein